MHPCGVHPGTREKPRPTRCRPADHPLVPDDYPPLVRARTAGSLPRRKQPKLGSLPKLPCEYLDFHTTFDEYKLAQTVDSLLNTLSTNNLRGNKNVLIRQAKPTRENSGFAHDSWASHFDWRQGKPYIDWWSTSENKNGAYFGKIYAPRRTAPPREARRGPSRNIRACDMDEEQHTSRDKPGFISPGPIPRFPLPTNSLVPYVPCSLPRAMTR